MCSEYNQCNQDALSELLGQTLSAVQGRAGDEEMLFTLKDGRVFRMYHEQGCCETVEVYDIAGDMKDLVGSPILQAEESSSDDIPDDVKMSRDEVDSCTWTFYKFATIKGSVTIRWFGQSNGYYSEAVDYEMLQGQSNDS